MRISDWSSDVCSSDLRQTRLLRQPAFSRRKKEKGQWLTPDTRAIPTGNGPRWAGPVQTAPPTPKATACSSIHDPARPMQATPRPAHQPSSTTWQASKADPFPPIDTTDNRSFIMGITHINLSQLRLSPLTHTPLKHSTVEPLPAHFA